MTSITISQQVKAIKEATKTAAQSKESALQFLKDAGIAKTNSSHKSVASSTANTSHKK